MRSELKAKSSLNPTEDLDKVIQALSQLFDYQELIIEGDQVLVSGDTYSLLPLKEALKKRGVRDTAQKVFLEGVEEGFLKFKLSKQAAYAGKTILVDEDLSTLGEIEVTIKTSNPLEFIEWLCSKE